MQSNPKKIRVLHLFANLNLGGAESRMMDFYRTQEQSDIINDFVIMTNEKCYFTDEVLNSGGTIHTIADPRNSLPNTLWQLLKLLRTQPKYNAIHAHTSYFSGMVVFIAWLAGIKKRITQAHTQGLGHIGQHKGFKFKLGSMLCKFFATTRFAVSSNAGKFLYGNTPYDLVSLSFDFSSFKHVSDSQRLPNQNALNISTATINVISVARFCIVKNHTFMLNVAQACKTQGIAVCFHFIGEGEERKIIEDLVDNMHLKSSIRFWGSRSDVSNIISLFDVMIMPSISEGLGVTALEAQAAGVPCILSNGVPKEADIGLGLCKYLSLEQCIDDWVQAINTVSSMHAPNKEITDQAFINNGYLLKTARHIYRESYQ